MNTKYKLADVLYVKNNKTWTIGRVIKIYIDTAGVYYVLQCDSNKHSAVHEVHEDTVRLLAEYNNLENSTSNEG